MAYSAVCQRRGVVSGSSLVTAASVAAVHRFVSEPGFVSGCIPLAMSLRALARSMPVNHPQSIHPDHPPPPSLFAATTASVR